MATKEELEAQMSPSDVKYVIREKVDVKSKFSGWWSNFTVSEDGSFIWAIKRLIYWIKVACDGVTQFFKARAEEKRLRREAIENGEIEEAKK